MPSYDVIIAGGGPAGLSTALHLLQIDPGWAGRLLVLEKAVHPRPKLCGGGVTRLGLEVLRRLELPHPLPIPHVQVEDVRLLYHGRAIHVRGKPQFTIFHRPELDAYLAETLRQRGGCIREKEEVQQILPGADSVTVITNHGSYQACILVGADGSNGLARRLVNPRSSLTRVARTLELLDPADLNTAHFRERFAVFDFSQARRRLLQGYLWDFPGLKEGKPVFSRGIYDSGLEVLMKRPHLPSLLRDYNAARGNDGHSGLLGYPIHLYDPRLRLSIPRLLLVGDAGGIDPLLGEGIAPSLAYGQVAAWAIQDAFQRRDFSLKDYRARFLRSEVGDYLSFRWFVANTMYRFAIVPGFLHMAWTVLQLLALAWPVPESLYDK